MFSAELCRTRYGIKLCPLVGEQIKEMQHVKNSTHKAKAQMELRADPKTSGGFKKKQQTTVSKTANFAVLPLMNPLPFPSSATQSPS